MAQLKFSSKKKNKKKFSKFSSTEKCENEMKPGWIAARTESYSREM